MLSRFIRYMQGYLRIRVSGRSAERFLNACRYRGIRLWGLKAAGDFYEMNISVGGYKQLRPIVRKTGTSAVIIERVGFPFFLHRYRSRRIFFAGAFGALCLVLLLSGFIWNIDISGNRTRTDDTLLRFLETRSVKTGMAKSKVDCARIVKDIRKEYDDIIWVSASVVGTRLLIRVKENEDSPDILQTEAGEKKRNGGSAKEGVKPVDIVADRDCTIESAVVRSGILVAKPGSKVKKGDVIVSGQVPVNDDAGETVAWQYHISDADIIGQCVLEYSDSCAGTYTQKSEVGIRKEEYALQFGKLRFVLGGIKNDYEHFRMNGRQGQLRLFGILRLPVYWGMRTAEPYRTAEREYSESEVQRILSGRFQRYIEDLEKKGVEIIRNDVKIYRGSETSEAKGRLTVRMPVGREKDSERKEIPEKGEDEETGDTVDGNDGSGH